LHFVLKFDIFTNSSLGIYSSVGCRAKIRQDTGLA